MLVHGSKPASLFRRLRRWVTNQVIQEVSGDIAGSLQHLAEVAQSPNSREEAIERRCSWSLSVAHSIGRGLPPSFSLQ